MGCILLVSDSLGEGLAARIALGADGVVEHLHPLGSLSLLQKLNNFRIELLSHFVFVVPSVCRVIRFEIVNGKALFVDAELLRVVPCIVYLDLRRLIARLVYTFGFLSLVKVEFR